MHLDRLDRICPLCVRRNAYVLEDEYRFLMVCPQYEDIRYKFVFSDNMIDDVSLNKFYSFLSSKNELAKYLYYAFKKRITKLLLEE